jgi:hypothetical protein
VQDITFCVEKYFMGNDLVTPLYLLSYRNNLDLVYIIPAILNIQPSYNALLGNLAGYLI